MAQNREGKDAGFVRLSETALVREIEGESVLLDLQTETYFSLDDVGSDVLDAVTAADDLDAALTVLVARYDVEKATLRKDVVALLQELKDAGLIIGQW